MTQPELNLKGFVFQELFTLSGLRKLDQKFLDHLKSADSYLYDQLMGYRQGKLSDPIEISQLLIECGPILEIFISELFDIKTSVQSMQESILIQNPIFAFKQHYVLRLARRMPHQQDLGESFQILDQWLEDQIIQHRLSHQLSEQIPVTDRELAVSQLGIFWLENNALNQQKIDRLAQWCAACLTTDSGKAAVANWVSFKLPNKLNYENLVHVKPKINDPISRLESPLDLNLRDGFKLTDPRMNSREALNEMHYCVYCHKTDGDFCSKGFPVKKNQRDLGLKINPLDEVLTGCPLEEKISEMHYLKKEGYGIAALAVVMIDNPTCPVTGHRICNDCMKACIYQKQDPVNIPQAETHILTDVLNLPWGVEIYDLLTRWNPLHKTQWVPKEYNGLKVLIMGMGPAGFTLAHYLLMEGFAVVGADGLKIEPLPSHVIEKPIYRYEDLKESLDNRIMAGFGGVAEYGITVRWDKNFLKLIYISLMRRPYFQVFGSVRFGGTLLVEDAWRLGFDHLAVAVGAGLPRELSIPGSLAPGMRQANDFLMALQLTGAAKETSMANLQVRLPAVVIGGGLTGIDTATEVQAYYIAQVEKVLKRYQALVNHYGEATVRKKFNPPELEILDEFLSHGKTVVMERDKAKQENRKPDFIHLIRGWGGVTVAYRRAMQESPAYRRNHEEVMNALAEGIYYAEGLEPQAVILDDNGYVSALRCKWRVMDEEGNWLFTDEEQTLSARAIFVATGAKPNIAYEFEHRGTFLRNGFDYQRHELKDGQLKPVDLVGHVKIEHFGSFTSYQQDHRRVTFLGDTHPVFHGSVVKAIASAKRTYPVIINSLNHKFRVLDEKEYRDFRHQMENLFRANLVSVKRLTDKAVELKIVAPMAARNFQPGQFYRLQNYETSAPVIDHTRLQTESVALIGIKEDEEPDILTFVVFEKGASSRIMASLKPGEPMAVMGPTGARSQILEPGKTVMIIGDSMAAIHLLSLGPFLRKQGNRVIFIGYYESKKDLFYQDKIEALADSILWITTFGEPIQPNRPQDQSVTNEFIMAVYEYAKQEDHLPIPLSQVNLVYVIGSSHILRMIQKARGALLKEYFAPNILFQGSVHGPMQCMLKGVCAQCLQWQIDPATGERTKAVYACSWQNQPMEMIDIDNIDERLDQNRVHEVLGTLWLDYLLEVGR